MCRGSSQHTTTNPDFPAPIARNFRENRNPCSAATSLLSLQTGAQVGVCLFEITGNLRLWQIYCTSIAQTGRLSGPNLSVNSTQDTPRVRFNGANHKQTRFQQPIDFICTWRHINTSCRWVLAIFVVQTRYKGQILILTSLVRILATS